MPVTATPQPVAISSNGKGSSKQARSETLSKQTSADFLNLKKPLIPQMLSKSFTKEFYLEQVHKPRYLSGSACFFSQPYLEMFTRTPWWVVPLFWTPIVAVHLFEAAKDFTGSAFMHSALFLLVAAGIFAWTLLEYGFHRFLFHMEAALPNRQLAFTLHFLLHGVHHFLPMDRMRLVMPPVLFAFLSSGPYLLFRCILGQKILNPLYSGAVSAYICYDMAHYFFHHGRSPIDLVNRMKSYHMEHHFKDPNLGYGVTSVLWDTVFGTTFAAKRA
jgi:4-hydroxysphinganine ceramide fatty acyl 2-hydroxylase